MGAGTARAQSSDSIDLLRGHRDGNHDARVSTVIRTPALLFLSHRSDPDYTRSVFPRGIKHFCGPGFRFHCRTALISTARAEQEKLSSFGTPGSG